VSYVDEASNKYYYKQLANATKAVGNWQCQSLGGHLPIVRTPGKQKFLVKTFGDSVWLALSSDNSK
jgi:hypothetical protein